MSATPTGLTECGNLTRARRLGSKWTAWLAYIQPRHLNQASGRRPVASISSRAKG
jgi:hypothetical protein